MEIEGRIFKKMDEEAMEGGNRGQGEDYDKKTWSSGQGKKRSM